MAKKPARRKSVKATSTAKRRARPAARPKPTPSREDVARRQRLVEICESLPEVTCKPFGEDHLGFAVGKKTFGYYLFHHHGDGIIAFCAKAAPGVQQRLVTGDPKRYRIPAYLGPSGWVSIRLDTPEVDWGDVLERIVEAYRLQAPRRLVAQM